MADAVIDPNAQGMAASRPYLSQGGGESIDDLRKRFAGLITQGNFSQGDVTNSPLANKLSTMGTQKMNDASDSFERNLPIAYMERQKGFQNVSDQNMQILREQQALREQQQAAKNAKRRGLATGVLGLAGAGAGLALSGGNPYAAMAGAGAGTALGSQI